jgi:hypothetical protein
MSLLGEDQSMIITISKDEKHIRSDDGVWGSSLFTSFPGRLISDLVNEMPLCS